MRAITTTTGQSLALPRDDNTAPGERAGFGCTHARMRSSLAIVLFGLVACGGAPEGSRVSGGGGGGSAARAARSRRRPGDVSFEVPAIEIKGLAFEPEALGTPGMPLAEPKGQASR